MTKAGADRLRRLSSFSGDDLKRDDIAIDRKAPMS
jgi:hypothetical protein